VGAEVLARAGQILGEVGAVFLTGGDQLRLTSVLGGTPLCEEIRSFHARGGTIAGTSAGASVMTETMLVAGAGDESLRLGDSLRMGAGLGFLRGAIVDQHFAERGRLGRLLAGVAQNPRLLGIGIDEDTATIVEGSALRVLGAGAVYVIDAEDATASNVADGRTGEVLSLFGARLHALGEGDGFDLAERRPVPGAGRD
jgi:cyanophycinase